MTTPKRKSVKQDPLLEKRYAHDDIRNVMFESIDSKYARGKFGPFEVIMMKRNGYINASKLCSSSGKHFREWMKLKSAKSFIEEVETSHSDDGIPSSELIVRRKDGNIVGGTYVHPDLVIAIAMWCSTKYALMVTKIMQEFHASEAIKEKDRIIGKKDDMINELNKKVDKLLEMNAEQTQMLEDIQNQNDELSEKLGIACTSRVIDGAKPKQNALVVVQNNAKPKKFVKDDPPYYDFKVFRVANRNLPALLKSHKAKYPASKTVLEIKYTPNAVQLWQRFTEKYGDTLDLNGCQFNLTEDATLKKTLKRIRKVHIARLEVE